MEKPGTPVAWLVHEGQLVVIKTEEGQGSAAAIEEETAKRKLKPSDAIPGSPPDDYKAIWEAKHSPSPESVPAASKPNPSPESPSPVPIAESQTIPTPDTEPESSKPRRRGDNWDKMLKGIRSTQSWTHTDAP